MINKGINAKIFWKNVKELRKNLDKTQTQIAKTIGLSATYYSNLERGIQKTVNPDTAEKIALALGVSIEELSNGEPTAEPIFWKNVKHRRAQLGFTQADMATALGINEQAYTYKEAVSPVNVKLEEAKAIATKLDTSIAELMGRKEMVWSKLSETAKQWLCDDANIALVEQLAKKQS